MKEISISDDFENVDANGFRMPMIFFSCSHNVYSVVPISVSVPPVNMFFPSFTFKLTILMR